ncbi:MAG: 50S ribosomal protein L29 [bacterium]
MKINEIRQKNKEQIEKLIHDQREKLKDMVFGGAGSREKNVKLEKTIKKDIARFFTVLNEAKKEVVVEVKKAEVKVKKVAKKVSTKK